MNGLDLIILAILAFFAITSFLKGFVREAFSLGGVILGVVAANNFYVQVGRVLNQMIARPELANIIAYVATFAVVAVVCNILGKFFDGFVKLVLLKWLDRLLGLTFGLVKGLIVVSILVLVLQMVLPQTSAFISKSELQPKIAALHVFLPSTVLEKIREKKEILEHTRKNWNVSPSFVRIEKSFSPDTVDTKYEFVNFDGARAELNLSISKAYLDAPNKGWRGFAKPGNSSRQNYDAYINGLYKEHKSKMKFAFDVFQKALPNVTDDYLLQSMICFVQSGLPYRVPPLELNGLQTGGVLPPPLALSEGYGDCDTKSLLFCCMASHKFDVIFLAGSKHAFVGVAGEPARGQQFVEISGKKYILCEMSTRWPLGRIPATTQNQINDGQFYYIHMR